MGRFRTPGEFFQSSTRAGLDFSRAIKERAGGHPMDIADFDKALLCRSRFHLFRQNFPLQGVGPQQTAIGKQKSCPDPVNPRITKCQTAALPEEADIPPDESSRSKRLDL